MGDCEWGMGKNSFSVFGFRISVFGSPPSGCLIHSVMKILVLQLKRIGDLILTTPALFALRQKYPEARITLAVEQGCRELLPALDVVDKTLVFSRARSNGWLWCKLALTSYDVCLDFTGNDRSAFFSILSKAPRRVAFQRVQKSRGRSLFYNSFVDSSVRENHTVDHYLDLLQAIDIQAEGTPIALHLPAWAYKKAGQLLGEAGVSGPFVVVHPGTARPEKYWLPERWAEVIEYCRTELRLPCVLTGSKDRFEQEHAAKIKESATCFDLSGRIDLLTLASLAQQARLFLSVDSAPMHMAAAFGTPQVALFGTTNPFHWRPRHPNAVIVAAGKPGPDGTWRPQYEGGPMSQLLTPQVTEAIKSLL